MLSLMQKKTLLQIARQAIAARWQEEPAGDEDLADLRALSHHFSGVFVSLHAGKKLRGCIGNLTNAAPLPELVAEMAAAAARHDPRFAPLRPDELDKVDIEISLLYPMTPLHSPDEIVIGRDGLMVRLGKKHGLLLPQVAPQRGWNALAFLQCVCRKADLPPEAWKNPQAEVLRFRAEVFSNRSLA